ncbi:hypothetical protein PRIPAC_74933 [Pristionchus pacificus]|uniref:MYND-type domain-containing protein n=1 Tax=Pristionchus pacificus TaxID=54126 RepID=A0A2A6CZQ2_PRIPA|nr:hypothetical protein PRIPAC_74933 [Pristionchus pacificus]|eukprot:PDM83702.1 hypothetical protein PRIPAC_30189 [Pristionchus pacificus]
MCTIVEEEPYVAVVDNPYLRDICSYCFHRAPPEHPLKRCTQCQLVHYCNKDCQRNDFAIHKLECSFIVNSKPQIPQSKPRLLGRLLIRKYKGDSTSVKAFNGRCFDDLMDHVEDIQKSSDYLPLFTALCYGLPNYVDQEFMVQAPELLRIFGRTVINCFGITEDDHTVVGEGVYLGLSALNHSCDPDAFVRFRGRKAVLRTANPEIKRFSNQITIPYTNLDALTKERRTDLEKQYFFKCNCKVCTDPLRDGYARSLKCGECQMGVCIVIESLQVLTCDQCGAVNPTDVDEAFRMNQEIEWQLEKEKGKNDTFLNLQSDMTLFAKYDNILSKYNLPLASLAYRIANLSLSLDRRDLGLKHANKFVEAYRRYLPQCHPLLTTILQTAAIAASFEDPPTGRTLFMFEEARAACHLSHGPGPIMDELNRQTGMFRIRMHTYSN